MKILQDIKHMFFLLQLLSTIKFVHLFYIFICLLFTSWVQADTPPSVFSVSAIHSDSTGVVTITYKLTDADNDKCTVSVQVSADGGNTWTITPSSDALSGAVGTNISPGSGIKTIAWASKTDLPGAYGTNYRIRITADDNYNPSGVEFVSIPSGSFQMGDNFSEGWGEERPVHTVTLASFQMSKHEITNAQYAQFLNAAKAQNKLKEVSGVVYAITDSSNAQPWFYTSSAAYLYDPNFGKYSQIASSGGAYSVKTRDSQAQTNHPVVEVSWYGENCILYFFLHGNFYI